MTTAVAAFQMMNSFPFLMTHSSLNETELDSSQHEYDKGTVSVEEPSADEDVGIDDDNNRNDYDDHKDDDDDDDDDEEANEDVSPSVITSKTTTPTIAPTSQAWMSPH